MKTFTLSLLFLSFGTCFAQEENFLGSKITIRGHDGKKIEINAVTSVRFYGRPKKIKRKFGIEPEFGVLRIRTKENVIQI